MFTTLSNGLLGVRTAIPIQVRSPGAEELPQGSPPPADSPTSTNLPILDFVVSDESLDRYDEVICASGWRLETYRRNPVFQNAHQYGDILFTLGKALITDVRTVAGRQALFQRIQFATDVNPVARIAHGLYSGGFLNAVSVGFLPLRWQNCDPVGQASTPAGSLGVPPRVPPASALRSESPQPRRRYLEQELLEVSAVAIPANPNALALAVKSGAVNKSDLRETLELLKNLSSLITTTQPVANPAQLLSFARELQRVLRRA
jgi:hypothetical protein